jgi:flagellar motor switch protein FliN/FliY
MSSAALTTLELASNNCVIARGDVVVMEGNYGVRIREIMTREGRLRHLR